MKGLLTVDEIKAMVAEYKDEAVDLLQGALRTPSPTFEEAAMSNYMEAKIKEIGLEPRRYAYDGERANILADWIGDASGKKFIFNGHMDVFPENEGVEGKYGPWSGHIEGDRIYGRGAVDMKSGDCAALMAVRILKEKGYIPDGKIMLSYMVDEENNSRKGVLALINDGLINDGDLGLCMEPTNEMAKMQESGVWQVDVTYTGNGGHTTNDDTGMDALRKAITAINALYEKQKEVEARKASGMKHPYFRVNTLHAGTMSNTLPTQAVFGFDRRFDVEEKLEDVQKEFFDVLDKLKEENPEMEYTYNEIALYPSSIREESNIYIKEIIEAIEECRGHGVERLRNCGSSDSSHLMYHTPVQMLLYGPGETKYTSTPDENVSITSYLQFIADYINVLNKALGLTKK